MSEINTALLYDFIDEAKEHLDEMESLLLQLGSDLNNLELLNDIFRTMHNVKGTSQMTGLDKIARLSHRMEDLLDLLRQGTMQTTPEMVLLFIAGRDRILDLVTELEQSQQELSSVDALIEELSLLIDGGEGSVAVTESREAAVSVRPEATGSEYVEEGDEELFGIFLDHLKEQFGLLSEVASCSEQGSVDEEQLLKCMDAVQRLKSAADYMGYDAMVNFFEAWDEALENARGYLLRGDAAPMEFMGRYLDNLITTFPQLEEIRETAPEITDIPKQVDMAEGDVSASVMDAFADEGEDGITSSVLDAFGDEDGITSSVLDAFGEDTAGLNGAGDISTDQPFSVENEPVAESNIDLTLVDDFIDESREHLVEMESLLLELLNDVENSDSLNDIFRMMHNVKGASQMTGLDKISRLSHRMEDLLDLLRQGEMVVERQTVELLIAGHDRLKLLIDELEITRQESTSVEDLIAQLSTMIDGSVAVMAGLPESDVNSVEPVDAYSAGAISSQPTIAAESFEEEHDQELFGIFVSHLGEQLGEIASKREQIKVLHNVHEQVEQLEGCLDAVTSMRSSANYMGYDELIGFYETWMSALNDAIESAPHVDDGSLEFMDYYPGELRRVFPQLSEYKVKESVPKSVEKASEEQPRVARPVVPTPAPPPSIVPHAPQVTPVSVIPDASIPDSPIKEQQDNELFERMNSALESSLDNVSDSQRETFNEVFDVLMSPKSGEETAADTKASTVSRSALKPRQQGDRRGDERRKKEEGEKKLRKSIRVDAEKIDLLMNQVGELIVDRSYFFQLFNELRELQQHLKDTTGIDPKEVKVMRTFVNRLSEAISGLGRTTNELQEGVMKMRMLPVSHLFNRYPRLVHDLTGNIDKNVNLVLRGEDTELDRMIVEELSDPLIHIIRNAIDHGIETTEERLRSGKHADGTLILEAYHESNHIVIEVVDDGRGLDPEKIRQKVISKGIYTQAEAERLSEREITNLILLPGFSTADKITGTSGRGVGMDVVKKNIEKLNGTLDIGSKVGKGTRMRMKIPLTLAIIHALMVRVGKDIFTIPLANVDETVSIKAEDTSLVEGVEVIHLRGETLPIFRLSTLFKVAADEGSEKSFVVIVNTDGQRVGFVIDELHGQEEVVIKPLEDYVQERSGFSGATIVGDGRISLILDIYELVKMTTRMQIKRHKEQAEYLRFAKHKLNESQNAESATSQRW